MSSLPKAREAGRRPRLAVSLPLQEFRVLARPCEGAVQGRVPTGASGTQVLQAAQGLQNNSQQLRDQVDGFLKHLKVA